MSDAGPDRDRWQRIRQLFGEALTRPLTERHRFLLDVCADDSAIRREVESLLASHDEAGERFEGRRPVGAAPAPSGIPVPPQPVALTAGHRLGPYEVIALLGVGGMGEVYRARDTRLGRDVALKILPTAFTRDPERMARFEREARVLAALNHPQIAAIHGIEERGDVIALVLELVEGETLAERLQRGALPVRDALAAAIHVANALDAAHEKGIVHRDLKPANIQLTHGGLKVLDFGIAKAARVGETDDVEAGAAHTRTGMIIGTAAYMSPEQACGDTVDKRADVWAFGAVLYEMLTGRAAFARDTVSGTFTAILNDQPDWTCLPADVPPSILRLLRRCLEKDQRRRLRDIGDARLELEDAMAGGSATMGVRSRAAVGPGRERVIWAAAVAALLVIVAALGYQLQETRRGAAGPIRLKLAALQGGTVGNAVGSGLVDVINRTVPGVRLEMIEVPAIRALRDLDTGQVQFAITTNLLAFHAVKTDQLLGHRSDAIAALTTAWAVPAQIVVRSDSDVKSIADLKGKRVSLDEADTNGQFASPLLLSHFGLNSTDVVDQSSGVATSLENMRQDRLDAYIAWRGVPLPEFTEAFTSGKFRLISLDPELLRGLKLKHPFLTIDTLPPRLYPHQDGPVVTISSRILLIASRSLPDDLVNQVMSSLAAHMPDLIARHPAAADIQVKRRPTIDDGLSIDLHPGAERFFESVSR